uniref:Uncharacterized protein n=1 Tax=Rhizophora mucronata TaxID=61149 RepID=A0A2P2JT17_RHIMU
MGKSLSNFLKQLIYVICSLCRCLNKEHPILLSIVDTILNRYFSVLMKIGLVTNQSHDYIRAPMFLQLLNPILCFCE